MYLNDYRTHKWGAVAVALLLVAGASAAHAQGDPLKCRRTIAKSAAKFEAAKMKALQKCEDGVLKGGTGPCPDSKAAGKISSALTKMNDKITGACAGVALADMNFAGLGSQCSGGYTPGLPCQAPGDCSGSCEGGRFEGEPCVADSFCTGFCGEPSPGTPCSTDDDCTDPEQCSDGICVTPRSPVQACSSDAACTTMPYTTCYEESIGCTHIGDCQPVDVCPSVQQDARNNPFGVGDDAADDCYFPLASEIDVASCVACVGELTVDQLISTYYATANPPSEDSAVLKCQRTLGKSAAKYFATVRKSLQKCQDAVLKGGAGPCPDGKASGKISAAKTKLTDKITAACPDAAALMQAFKITEFVGRSGRPDGACSTLVTDPASAADAIECLTNATATCEDALGVGSSPAGCNQLCGNSKIDAGETCDDGNQLQESGSGAADVCPADCSVAACTPNGTATVTVEFTSTADVTGMTVLLYYDDAKVSIPGTLSDIAVQNAVTSGVFSMTPTDTDYALRNVLLDPFLTGVASGSDAFAVTFDKCDAAPAPAAADFKCYVVDSADATMPAPLPLIGTTCSVTVS